MSSILLQGGTLLLHDSANHVIPTVSDLLIQGNIIVKIAQSISVDDASTLIVNCKDKIISPGFISTHAHLWQTQHKGQHANDTLLSYFPKGVFAGALYSIEDAFWGTLAGAMEAVDAGTTTVLDHSHLNPGPQEYPKAVIQALATSGLRAIYAFCPFKYVTGWTPLTATDDFSPRTLASWQNLARHAPFGAGRVSLGFALDNVYLPREELQKLYGALREGGAQVITTHGAAGPAFGEKPSALQMLANADVLGPDVVVSHGNYPKDGDDLLCKRSGATISCTPNTELQMGWAPLALQREFNSHSSLGVDCHSWGSGFMPGQMRLLLQWARWERAVSLEQQEERRLWSRETGYEVEEVFNLATLSGARALGMADSIGRIAEGYKADLVVFGTESPSMLAAALEDPVAAIVLHSSERDVEMVLVDGVVRKDSRTLIGVAVEKGPGGEDVLGFIGKQLTWKEVVRKTLDSREQLKKKTHGIDFKATERVIAEQYHMSSSSMVEGTK